MGTCQLDRPRLDSPFQFHTAEPQTLTGIDTNIRPEVLIITDADRRLPDDRRRVELDQENLVLALRVSLGIERRQFPEASRIDPAEYYLL